MKKITLNARIPEGLKKAVDQFCDKRGLKVQAFIEDLIQERLEDELDQKLMEEREGEPTIPWNEIEKRLGLGIKKRS